MQSIKHWWEAYKRCESTCAGVRCQDMRVHLGDHWHMDWGKMVTTVWSEAQSDQTVGRRLSEMAAAQKAALAS